MGVGRDIAERAGESMVGLGPIDEFNVRMEHVGALNSYGLDPMANLAIYSAIIAGSEAAQEFNIQLRRYDVVSRAAELQQLVVLGKANVDARTGYDYKDTMLQAVIPLSGIRYSAETYGHKDPSVIIARASVYTFNALMGDQSNRLAHAMAFINVDGGESRYTDEAVASFLRGGEIDEAALRIYGSPIDSGQAWFETGIFRSHEENTPAGLNVVGEQRNDPLHGIHALGELVNSVEAVKRRREDQIRIVGLLAKAIEQARTGEPYASGVELMAASETQLGGFNQFRNQDNISHAVKADLGRLVALAAEVVPKSPAQWFKETVLQESR